MMQVALEILQGAGLKLLLDFGANYGGVADEIREALATKDFKQAHSLVHNLKGLSANSKASVWINFINFSPCTASTDPSEYK
jgi:hypothetical protein